MSQTCWLCKHPRRKQAEQMLAEGLTLKRVGDFVGLSQMSVLRHKRHSQQSLARFVAKREESIAASIVQKLTDLDDTGTRVMRGGEEAGDGRLVLGAIREIRDTLGAKYKMLQDALEASGVTVRVIDVVAEDKPPDKPSQ